MNGTWISRLITAFFVVLAADVSAALGAIFNLPPDPLPATLAAGDVLNIGPGVSVNDSQFLATGIQPGSTINVQGGALASSQVVSTRTKAGSVVNLYDGVFGNRSNISNSGGTWNVFGGRVDGWVWLEDGATLNVHGGTVAPGSVIADSTLNIDGGEMFAIPDMPIIRSEFNMSGGTIRFYEVGPRFFPLKLAGDSIWNLSGGHVMAPVHAYVPTVLISRYTSPSTVHITALSAMLDGAPLGGLTPGVPKVVMERDKILSGVLADGSPFQFALNSTNHGEREDYFPFESTVTVTLVPEPATAAFISTALVGLIRRHRQVS